MPRVSESQRFDRTIAQLISKRAMYTKGLAEIDALFAKYGITVNGSASTSRPAGAIAAPRANASPTTSPAKRSRRGRRKFSQTADALVLSMVKAKAQPPHRRDQHRLEAERSRWYGRQHARQAREGTEAKAHSDQGWAREQLQPDVMLGPRHIPSDESTFAAATAEWRRRVLRVEREIDQRIVIEVPRRRYHRSRRSTNPTGDC
jgi:hypothetical protein